MSIDDDALAPLMDKLGDGASPERERMHGRLAARMFGVEPEQPDRLGRFELRRPIGAGAMGVVYEAWDPQLDRRVALKLLRERPGAARTRGADQRLLREAKAMARLRHPNVVQVHDVGTHEGQVFVAMELIEGGSLREWLAARPRPWRAIVEVFIAAGRGLAAAHAGGLVHRDFKPDNVLIEGGRVFVGDFGLARSREVEIEIEAGAEFELDVTESSPDVQLDTEPGRRRPQPTRADDQPAGDAAPLTQTGTIVGTPAYMAPEAFLEPIADPRVDQYSFCASLYEALYGARPWSGKTLSELRAAKLRTIVTAPATRPATRPATGDADHRETPRARSATLPLWLRRAVVRGLSPKPGDRFASMDALLLELERGLRRARLIRRDLPIALATLSLVGGLALGLGAGMFAEPPSPAPCSDSPEQIAEVWSPDRRARVIAALGTGELAYAEQLAARTGAALDAYAERWVAAHHDACEATHVRGEQSARALDLRMRCLDRRRAELDALLTRFAAPTKDDRLNSLAAVDALAPVDGCADLELLETTTPVPDDPRIRAEVEHLRARLDAINAALGTSAHAEVEDEAHAVLDAAIAVGYRPLSAEAGVAHGVIASRLGKPKDAELTLEQAIVDAQAGGHDEFAARAMIAAIHVVGFQLRDTTGGERYLRQGRALLERIGDPPRLLASYTRNVGTFEFARGDYEQAREHFTRSIELLTALDGETHFSVAESRTNLAAVERRLGNLDEALALYEAAKRDFEASLGPEHPGLFNLLNNMAVVYMLGERHAEAEATLRQAIVLADRHLPETHASVGHPHNNLGELLVRQRRYAEAELSYTRALASWTASLGPEHPLVAHPLTGRGLARLELGDAERAREDLERALAIRGALDDSHVALAETEFMLARARAEFGEPAAEVRELAERALERLGERDGDLVTRADIQTWLAAR
jgi:eukaryotic-like serine/threonine-protein kinase